MDIVHMYNFSQGFKKNVHTCYLTAACISCKHAKMKVVINIDKSKILGVYSSLDHKIECLYKKENDKTNVDNRISN